MQAYVERSLKTNPRTTLRVKTEENGKRHMWAEIRESVHKNHYDIICKMKDMIERGLIKSRDEAMSVQAELLDS